jgi:hypothetical protein
MSHAKATRAAPARAGVGPRIEKARQPLDLPASLSDSRRQAPTLWPYQADAIAKIELAHREGARSVLLEIPKAFLVLGHRIEILEQIALACGQ